MSHRVECIVVGAGVVGLAIARALAMRHREVLVLEAGRSIGTGTSSRNSEVIHAGIYYPTGSLKARLCVTGRHLLYDYCERRQVAHRRLGKIFVATDDAELAALASYARRAEANGVEDLRQLSAAQAQALEPQLHCVAGLLSPATGIIDSHGLMQAYLADIEAHGGMVVTGTPVSGGCLRRDAVEVQVGGDAPISIRAGMLVNAAGLGAQALSSSLEGLPSATVPARHLAKGHYFALAGQAPFRRLIYPIADEASLGVHLTLDLAGNARFGPDVEWVDAIDYSVDERRRAAFAAAIRRYFPAIDESRLRPDYTGIRPKIAGPGQPSADFCIRGPGDHEELPYVALYGIESPGLTASLAIAEHVGALLR